MMNRVNREVSETRLLKKIESILVEKLNRFPSKFSDSLEAEKKTFTYEYQEIEITLHCVDEYETKQRSENTGGLLGFIFGSTKEVSYKEYSGPCYYARVQFSIGNEFNFNSKYKLGNSRYSSLFKLKGIISNKVIPAFESRGWIAIGHKQMNEGFTYYLMKEFEM